MKNLMARFEFHIAMSRPSTEHKDYLIMLGMAEARDHYGVKRRATYLRWRNMWIARGM